MGAVVIGQELLLPGSGAERTAKSAADGACGTTIPVRPVEE